MVFRHSVNVTLKELSNLVSGDGTSCFVYYQKNTDYLPYNWSNLPPTTNCLLIARKMDQWRASLMADSNHNIDKLEPKGNFVHKLSNILSYFLLYQLLSQYGTIFLFFNFFTIFTLFTINHSIAYPGR